MKEKVFVVLSHINFSTTDTDIRFSVVGVTDNKERAKEMVKEVNILEKILKA